MIYPVVFRRDVENRGVEAGLATPDSFLFIAFRDVRFLDLFFLLRLVGFDLGRFRNSVTVSVLNAVCHQDGGGTTEGVNWTGSD